MPLMGRLCPWQACGAPGPQGWVMIHVSPPPPLGPATVSTCRELGLSSPFFSQPTLLCFPPDNAHGNTDAPTRFRRIHPKLQA